MLHAQPGYLPQPVREFLQSDLRIDELDVLHLPHRGTDGFVEVGGLAVDQPVHRVAHIAHNADVFEFQKGLVAADQTEEFRNLLRFLQICYEPALAFDAFGIQLIAVHQLGETFRMLLIHRKDLKMVRRGFRIVYGAARKKCTAQIASDTAFLRLDLLADFVGEFACMHDIEILEHHPAVLFDPAYIYIVFLQLHLPAHQQFYFHPVHIFDETEYPSSDRRIFSLDVDDPVPVKMTERAVHLDQ